MRADGVSSLIVAAGERRGLLGMGFENMMRFWVMKRGVQQRASRWLGGAVRPRRKEREWGEGPSLAISAMFCLKFAYAFRLSVSMRKVASEHPFCVLIYMNSYIFQIFY